MSVFEPQLNTSEYRFLITYFSICKFHENWYCAMLQREGITCLFASDPSNRTLEYFNFNQKSFSNFSCMFLNPNIFFQFEF